MRARFHPRRSTALFAIDRPLPDAAEPALESADSSVAVEEAATESVEELDLLVANWVHVGCISLHGQCLDVFEDQHGDWWVCKACTTTGNPSPGKCRRLTPWEIANALWCA